MWLSSETPPTNPEKTGQPPFHPEHALPAKHTSSMCSRVASNTTLLKSDGRRLKSDPAAVGGLRDSAAVA
jgi:hypothetical protein